MTTPTKTPRYDELMSNEVNRNDLAAWQSTVHALETELAAAHASLAFRSAQVDRILIEETANTKREKEKREAAEKALASARAEADELARRVALRFSVEAVNCARYGSVYPGVEEIIARVRAEMEKEKGNG